MLSSKTYAIWNSVLVVLAALFALSSIMEGQYAIGAAELFVSLVFVVFAIMAYLGKGIYVRHPTTLKPSGEIVSKEKENEGPQQR